jgi:tellurite resistance protein TerC
LTAFIWFGFAVVALLAVALDLGAFHRKTHVVSISEALIWTAVWIGLALAFNAWVYFLHGGNAALHFLTGYIVEKALSLDNVFIIAMIFAFFRVPVAQQDRLLTWGVLGVVLLRGEMLVLGAALFARFDWIVYLFGALLLASAGKVLVTRHDNLDPSRNLLVRLTARVYPLTNELHGDRFLVRGGGRTGATPLLVALILVLSSDVMFAVDSIPSIFTITRDPFLVVTTNVFAVLGLRSLYFALAGLMDRFRYLKTSLVFVLAYIGVQTLLMHDHPIPVSVTLGVVGGILTVGILASVMGGRTDTAALVSPLFDEIELLATLTYRQARRIVILIIGTTVALLGVVMIVTPGPAFVVIPLGLSILAIEFAWAQRWLKNVRRATDGIGRYVLKTFRRRPRTPGPR